MSYKEPGRKPLHYAWSQAWLRNLSDSDVTVLATLARQQMDLHAPRKKIEEKRALLTIQEHERRLRVSGHQMQAVAAAA